MQPAKGIKMSRSYETPVITTLAANEILDNLGPAQSLSSGGGVSGSGPSSVIGGGSNTFGG
jgi:hypothetical protein